MRIGFFDSGIGGLSVLRHAIAHIPAAEYLYVADSVHAPYGDRPAEWVRKRSLQISRQLGAHGLDALVIACNTATALAAEAIRAELRIPVVAMEPAIKPAARNTRNRRVAVLATASTLGSERFRLLKERYATDIEVLEYAPHHWIRQIEAGAHREPEFQELLKEDLEPLLERAPDTWVLACTHFPLIQDRIADLAGEGATIIDPAPAVTAELKRRLGVSPEDRAGAPRLRLLTSGNPGEVGLRASQFLPEPVLAEAFSGS